MPRLDCASSLYEVGIYIGHAQDGYVPDERLFVIRPDHRASMPRSADYRAAKERDEQG
jgi:hypothetical protein